MAKDKGMSQKVELLTITGLPLLVFFLSILATEDVLDRCRYADAFVTFIKDVAPWVIGRARYSDFDQVTALGGGLVALFFLPQFLIFMTSMDVGRLERRRGEVLSFWMMFILISVSVIVFAFSLLYGSGVFGAPSTRMAILPFVNRFYAALVDAALLFVLPACLATALHIFYAFVVRAFGFKNGGAK